MRRPILPLVATLLVTAFLAALPASADAAQGRLPRRALWIETSANLRLLSNREAIRAMVERARAAGIDTLIPEAKNAWGFVIYESAFVAHIRTSPLARYGYPPPAEWFPKDFDPLHVLIEEAHAAGLRVHPAVNAFGEGVTLDRARPTVGLVGSRPEWESVHLRPGPNGEPVLVRSSAAVAIAFVNPAHPEAQLYELAILWEILARYDVDGIVLDRARFAGVDADFSDLSRSLFEAHLGRRVAQWPHDVLDPTSKTLRPGPLFSSWVAWRASVIQAYVRAASRLIRQMRPGLPVGMYVGAWYPTIFEVGQNWAQPEAPRLFSAWSDAWAQASLTPYLDYLMIGLYYRAISPWEAARGRTAWWRSVAGGAVLGREVTGDLPLLGTVWLDLYKEDRARAEAAIRAIARLTDGLTVFDLSDVEQGAWWGVLGGR
ncbi:MAG: family 10 glycosylhydrolase [Armatimonadota bacterium]